MNHGSRKGSGPVARAIEAAGVLKVGPNNWHGRGVYGHFEEYTSLYEGKPYVIFEADVDPDQIQRVQTTGGRAFFVIRCEDALAITVIAFHNVED